MLRKLLQIVTLLSLLAGTCFAQGIRYDNIALTTKNTAFGTATVPVAGASVAVCSQPAVTVTTPCSPRISLYSDQALTQSLANPTSADAKGNYHFYYNASVGAITVQIYASTVSTYVMPDQDGMLSVLQSFTWPGTQVFDTIDVTTANITNANITNLTVGGQSITFPLPILHGGTGATSFAAANLPVFTGVINVGDCPVWSSASPPTLGDNGAPCGGGGGGGTVTSVAMTGDGVVFNATVPGSPIVGAGTLAPTLKSVNTGYVLAGPIGSLGTNVGVRQFVHCTTSVALNSAANQNFSCPAFGSSLISGDLLLVLAPGQSNDTTAGFTDTQGNTFTIKASGGSNPHLGAIATAPVGSSAADTVSATNIHWWDNGGSWSQYDFWVFELTGAAAINLAYVNEGVSGGSPSSATLTQAISPGASTDALIRLAIAGSNNVGSPLTGTTTISPVGSTTSTFTSADVGMGFGKTDVFAPGSTASVSNVGTWTITGGSSPIYYLLVADITQNGSAGSAPPVYRPLQEGDLPASAISAIQAVNKYTVPSPVNLPSNTNTTVLSKTVTMPSSGCPCRVEIITSGIVNSTASGVWTSWVSDGTTDFATVQSITTDGHAPPLTGHDFSSTYASNQSVTFTWKVNPGTYTDSPTMQINSSAAAATSSLGSYMDLVVMQSRN